MSTVPRLKGETSPSGQISAEATVESGCRFPARSEIRTAGVVNETGIYLSNGQGATITLIGPTVAINNTGLTITGP